MNFAIVKILRRRSRRARLWNMGILLLIYYSVTVYSAKSSYFLTSKTADAEDIRSLVEESDNNEDTSTNGEATSSETTIGTDVSSEGPTEEVRWQANYERGS